MTSAFLSQDWYRVAALKPRLREHVEIHRHRLRGQTWHIVQDLHTGNYHRISPAGNMMISLMDGRRPVQKLWEIACDRFEDDPPSQSEVIRLLSQLHTADLIAGDTPPDIEELGRRHRRQERQSMLAKIRNPLAVRFPLFDPDRFLAATLSWVRPIFTVWGFVAWLGLIATGVTLAVLNWGPLTEDIADRVLSQQNILLLAVAYPLIKTLHELGHAYATKVWGGEVHEIGIMMLVLIPIPYVDATASAAFPEKWRRAVVGGSGIMVELALAALAMIFWVNAEQGLARAFAFNIMLTGGISTLLFNGNPLLRFDGYFVMTDVLEISNLGQRANKYFFYLVRRYLFGQRKAESPVLASGERGWFVFYSVAAFLYRISISIAIALFIASKLFIVGVLLAAWALSNSLVFPVLKGIRFVWSSPSLRADRTRAIGVTAGVVALVAAVLFVVPAPYATLAEGFVLLEEDEILRSETMGFVAQPLVERGDVAADQPLLRMEDPILMAQLRVAEAQRVELVRRLAGTPLNKQSRSRSLQEQMRLLSARIEFYRQRVKALELRAPRAGLALIPEAEDLTGRLVRKGAILGYLLEGDGMRFRVGVPQATAELVRTGAAEVEIRLQRDLGEVLKGRIVSEAPESFALLPSPALGTGAGGPFAVDPTDPQGRRTLQSLFLFDVVPSEPAPMVMVGERAIVRFDHGAEPIGFRIFRSARQLFLSQFNV